MEANPFVQGPGVPLAAASTAHAHAVAMLTRWLLHRAWRGRAARQRRILPQQPVQNLYRPRQVRTLLERSGFRTARLITKAASPEAPLPGHYMRIYCLEAI